MPSAAEIWEQLDHHLVKEKWFAANEELREEIAREVNQIYSKNRGNLNSAVIPSQILEMELRKIDEWATRKCSIYREVWLLQGNEISPVFLRTIYAMDIRRLIDQRGSVAAYEAESIASRTGEAKRISDARIQSFRLKVKRMLSKGRRIV